MSFVLRVLVLIIPVSLIGLFFVLLSTENEYPGADYKIFEIPDFLLSNLNGTNKISNKDLEGDYILNVWASWCITCRVEHPFLIDLKDKGVPIIGLNYKDNKDDAINWLKNFKSPYEISIHDFYGTLALDLGVTGAPETYLLKDGIIVRRHIGELNIEKWRQDFADFF